MGILDSITLRLASSDSVSVRIAIAPTRRLATSGFLAEHGPCRTGQVPAPHAGALLGVAIPRRRGRQRLELLR